MTQTVKAHILHSMRSRHSALVNTAACLLCTALLLGCASTHAQNTADNSTAQSRAYTESGKSDSSVKVLYQAVDAASNLVNAALSYMGINYKYGGNEPETGFDCSGFVRYVYNNTLGLVLPRSSFEMSKQGEKVKKDELKPGDLVFFNTLRRAFSHVGIYIGEGKFVHAPATGGSVRVESMDIAYWQKRFNGARRLDTYTPTPNIESASNNQASTIDTSAEDALDQKLNELADKAGK